MILKMQKVYVVARKKEKERLLACLRDIGLVHIVSVEPSGGNADPEVVAKVGILERALQILSQIEPEGDTPDTSPMQAARKVLEIQKQEAEAKNLLGNLHRQAEHLSIWGEVTLKQFDQLKDNGIEVRFFYVPEDEIANIEAECFEVVGKPINKKIMVAIINRTGEPKLPEQSVELPLPQTDLPAVRAQAAKIDAKLKDDAKKLSSLAFLTDAMKSELVNYKNQENFSIAMDSGYEQGELFAVQGWIPAEQTESLQSGISQAGVDAAVEYIEPDEDEMPPTLIKYPKWTSPIKGLFEILGTVPGYREIDVSSFFMIAIPLFAAMLIGDAGYGLIFTIAPILFYRKLKNIAGSAKVNLIIIVGITTFVWGIISGNYFGLTPGTFINLGGKWSSFGGALASVAPLWDSNPEKVQVLLVKLSFLIGCLHLTLAHLRLAIAIFPNIKSLAEVGWCIFLWPMLGVIWGLFFGPDSLPVSTNTIIYGLIAGILLVILFTAPSKNPFKTIGIGIASAILPILGTFSDTISYIRLMAVGLATYYIASAFNTLGASVAPHATWFAAAPIIILGHLLNMGLAIIAIFAHGVRLNMLEFSNSAGIQWLGYQFNAFRKIKAN